MVKLYTQQQHDMMREGGSVWQLRRRHATKSRCISLASWWACMRDRALLSTTEG